MTREQLSKTKAALGSYGLKHSLAGPERKAWSAAVENTLAYYDELDPTRSALLRLRYLEHRTVEDTMARLNICPTTYHKAQLDMLSTLALFAAKYGAQL